MAQVRALLWRHATRNFSVKAETRRWANKKPAPEATQPQRQGRAAAPSKAPAMRKTWDKELKAWVPFVEKTADATADTPPKNRQAAWLKPSTSTEDKEPRFKLFGSGGEVKVDRKVLTPRMTPKKVEEEPKAAPKKSLKFEKNIFSNNFFPDVTWSSSKGSSTTTGRKDTRAPATRSYKPQTPPAFKARKFFKKKRAEPIRGLKVEIPSTITVEDLSERMCIKSERLLQTLRQLGERNLKDESELSAEVAELAVEEMGMIPILVEGFVDVVPTVVPDDCSAFPMRPPIVTVMGHVDHGKTTLLDALRQTTTKEAGGITQKIGSFTVPIDDTSIVFFDTPGHAAFATMRAQGSSLTDIIVVVIAADDGIQPQTREVLQLAVENGLPLIVAVTKCDRFPGQENEIVSRVTKELEEEGISEADMQLVCVSGKTGEGLDELKQAILLQAELMELRADVDVPGEGVVVEGSIARGLGVTVDTMVTWGTLKVGQLIVCGVEYGKIKSLIDENGKTIKQARAGTPVRLVGLKELPQTGLPILPVESEERAKEVVAERARILEQIKMKEAAAALVTKQHVSLGRRNKGRQLEVQRQERAAEEERMEALTPDDEGYVPKAVPILLKANALGIIDAIDHMIAEMNSISRECVLKRILAGVGPVTTSDIDLAVRTGATIFTFNTRQPSQIEKEAAHKQIEIKSHNVIYTLMDDIEVHLTSQMTHMDKEESVGMAEILQNIPINVKGRQKAAIAGVRVTEGSIFLDATYRIIRDGEVVMDGLSLESMRHFQDKISESPKGKECGVQFRDDDALFKVGDMIEAYRVVKVRPRLVRD
ncbi:unnamed protein product [Aphanomyces euteiches]